MRVLLTLFLAATLSPASTYYVASNGTDSSANNGSSAQPWASIGYAIDQVADGDTILVRPGTYNGRARVDGNFPGPGVLIKSEVPYMAKLRSTTSQTVVFFEAVGITMEGFDIAHGGTGGLVIQVSGFGSGLTHDVALINNIIHDSNNNDLLKVNHSCYNVTVRGNLFFNQEGSDEHIDANSVDNVVIEDNIFSSHFAASGFASRIGTVSASVVIKDSDGASDMYLGARNVTVRRNVFVNWQGSTGSGFVKIGEDGTSNWEAFDVLVENNLMLGNSPTVMRAPYQISGSRDITFRHNTVVGDLPALEGGLRIVKHGGNQPAQNIAFYNNIWSDPTGTMDSPFARVQSAADLQKSSFTLDNNLFWNNGNAIPQDGSQLVNFTDDSNRLVSSPLIGNPAALTIPYWNGATFADGSSTIAQVFQNMVNQWGTPLGGSPVVGAARSDQSPADDILGNPRGSDPDIGAVQVGGATGPSPCASVQFTPASHTVAATGAAVQFTITAPSATCTWTATDNAGWLNITSGSSGTGNGLISLTVAANAGSSARTGAINVNGSTASVTQSGQPVACNPTGILAPKRYFPSPATSGQTFEVTAAGNCSWTAQSSAGWLQFTSSAGGTGRGFVTFSLTNNGSGAPRTATITAGTHTLVITQRGTDTIFTDVVPEHFAFDGANLMYTRSITSGCASKPLRYCPQDIVTRGQMAVFIIRAALGTDEFPFPSQPFFTDVPASHPFFKWIQKMRELGYTSGCAANRFCPGSFVTRGQMAVFIIRLRLGPTANFTPPANPLFGDVGPGHPFYAWIQKLAELNITGGCAANAYCAEAFVTRGQMALFIIRARYNELMP